MRTLFAIAAATMALNACKSGAFLDVVSTDVVDRTYRTGSVTSNFSGTKIEVAVKVQEHSGKVLLCAAVAGDGKGTFGPEWPQAIADALIVSLDGDRLVTGTPFAKTYFEEKTVMGKASQCAVTSRLWQRKYEKMRLEITLPQVRLRA